MDYTTVVNQQLTRLGYDKDPAFVDFVLSLGNVESGGRVVNKDGSVFKGPVIKSGSMKGQRAYGALQIMPSTFAALPEVRRLGLDINKPEDAVAGGLAYAYKSWQLSKGDPYRAANRHITGSLDAKRKDGTTGISSTDYAAKVVQGMNAGNRTASVKSTQTSAPVPLPAPAADAAILGATDMSTVPVLPATKNVAPSFDEQMKRMSKEDAIIAYDNGLTPVQANQLSQLKQADVSSWIEKLDQARQSARLSTTEQEATIEALNKTREQQMAWDEALDKEREKTLAKAQDTALSMMLDREGEAVKDFQLPSAVDRYLDKKLMV